MIAKIRKIQPHMIFGIIYFLLVLIPAIITKIYLKITKKELWLICETKNTARDNGCVFYQYLKTEHPEITSYYAINKKCADYNKVENYGNILQWGGIKHYFYYMCCTKNISSHKEGNPNHGLFTVLHLYLNLYNNRVFLQHGILYQNFPMFHKKNTKFKLFISGAKLEYEYLKSKYGYDHEVKYTGLARFDNLHDYQVDKKCILLIPTWRRWLNNEEEFKQSEYFERLNSLINNKKLIKLLEKYDKYLYFYPHFSTQKFNKFYNVDNPRIKLLNVETADIQLLLKKGALLITDFSSIFTDFAYMHKPIIYYQYDFKKFYNTHINIKENDTYFDFEKIGFGKVVHEEEALIECLENYITNDFEMESQYEQRINEFFILHDKKNCERIFCEIIRCDKNE